MSQNLLRLLAIALACSAAPALHAQDTPGPEEPAQQAPAPPDDSNDDDAAAPSEEDDDVFIPTEEIPADEEVTFPVNI